MKGDPVDHPPDGLEANWRSRSAFTAVILVPTELIWIEFDFCIKLQQPKGVCVYPGFLSGILYQG